VELLPFIQIPIRFLRKSLHRRNGQMLENAKDEVIREASYAHQKNIMPKLLPGGNNSRNRRMRAAKGRPPESLPWRKGVPLGNHPLNCGKGTVGELCGP